MPLSYPKILMNLSWIIIQILFNARSVIESYMSWPENQNKIRYAYCKTDIR